MQLFSSTSSVGKLNHCFGKLQRFFDILSTLLL